MSRVAGRWIIGKDADGVRSTYIPSLHLIWTWWQPDANPARFALSNPEAACESDVRSILAGINSAILEQNLRVIAPSGEGARRG